MLYLEEVHKPQVELLNVSCVHRVVNSFIWRCCTAVECWYWWGQAWIQWSPEGCHLPCVPWWNTSQLIVTVLLTFITIVHVFGMLLSIVVPVGIHCVWIFSLIGKKW